MNQSNQIFAEPLGCLGVIGKSLWIMKNNALKLTCLTLLFYVPLLAIGLAQIKYWFANLGTDTVTFYVASSLMSLIDMFLGILVVSATIIAVKNCMLNIPINIGNILRQVFAKLLPIVVNSLLLLILLGLLIELMSFVIESIIGAELALLFMPLTMLVYLYLFIRLYFSLPSVLLNDRFLGVSDSWQLTKNNFWWLLRLGILTSIIAGIVTLIAILLIGMLVSSAPSQGILLDLSSIVDDIIILIIWLSPITIIVQMFSFTVYTVAYFNLYARNEAADRTSAICE